MNNTSRSDSLIVYVIQGTDIARVKESRCVALLSPRVDSTRQHSVVSTMLGD